MNRRLNFGPMLRRFTVVWATAVFLAVLAPALHAANYTITAGSADSIDFANAGLLPGDTVFIQSHTRKKLILRNLTAGTAENPILITNTGGQFVIDTTDTDKGLHFYNCSHFILRGTPSPGNYDYGIKIARVSQPGAIALAFIQGTTDFEVSHLEIANAGFAGIMAKSDNLDRDHFTMRNVSLHHLYIHDTGGEGIYVGSSFYQDTAKNPHEIHGVSIHDNLIENTGWDGIQLGCATQNATVYRNRIVGYGSNLTASDHSVQNEGIRINPGTTARVYDNYIQGGNAGSGSGIFANPHDDSTYSNNVIVSPGESGIVISSDAALNAGTTVVLINNTIVSPAQHGIEFWSVGSTGNVAINNLIAAPGGQFVFEKYPSVDLTVTTPLHAATVPGAGFRDAANHDYRLAPGSPAIDTGSAVSSYGVTTDREGVTRPFGTACDIGAHEYHASATGAPVIAAPPVSQSARVGDEVTFTVIASGNEPMTYAWTKNGSPVSGATTGTLTLSALSLGDAGDYTVTVTNALDSATSIATLTVIAPPPVIATQPASRTVMEGDDVTFTVAVSASSIGPLAYQWKIGGLEIPGETNASLTLPDILTTAAGDYTVTVSNPGGSITSEIATLTVNALPEVPTSLAITPLVSDTTVLPHVASGKTYTHAINLNASSPVTVNGVVFGFGTGNGGGAQAAKNYTLSSFSHAFTTFNSSATGGIHTLLATHATNTSSATYALTLTGLTPGKRYSLALFTNSSHGAGKNWYRVSQSSDSTTLDTDFSAGGVNSSRMLSASYTAVGTSTTFTFTRQDGIGTTGSSSWVGFAGFVNYEEPLPVIATHPLPQTVEAGDGVTFTITASGTGTLAYQWLKNSVPISGKTSASLTLAAAQASDAGDYSVIVTNAAGSVTSNAATLTVTQPDPFLAWAATAGLPDGHDGATDDPDGDNSTNLLEFAFGLNPLASDTASTTPAIAEWEGDLYPTVTFIRRQALGDTVINVIVTNDLDPAHDLGSLEVSSTERGDGTDTVVVRSTQPVSAQPRQFFHLQATRP